MESVDFVLRWVDDQDAEWSKRRDEYKSKEMGLHYSETKDTRSDQRYRDWGLLRYCFRGIEKNAPWFNKLFFVTCGQKPEWLNVNHPKLVLVNHKDFIPECWLPTFSSRAIDFNIYRIKGLSEQFVLFDDDTFIIGETKSEVFFQNGLPRDSMVFNALTASTEVFINANVYNNMAVINKYFSKSSFNKRERIHYWYNLKYGKYLYKNIVLSPWTYYLGFQDFHFPPGFLKSTYYEIWKNEKKLLSETCSHRFRKEKDVNQWLIRYWQLASKRFVPRSPKVGGYYELSDDNTNILDAIENKRSKLLCINEGDVSNFTTEKRKLQSAFEKILPNKSSFEL